MYNTYMTLYNVLNYILLIFLRIQLLARRGRGLIMSRRGFPISGSAGGRGSSAFMRGRGGADRSKTVAGTRFLCVCLIGYVLEQLVRYVCVCVSRGMCVCVCVCVC